LNGALAAGWFAVHYTSIVLLPLEKNTTPQVKTLTVFYPAVPAKSGLRVACHIVFSFADRSGTMRYHPLFDIPHCWC
jgi:hypothetical protein